MNHSFHSARLKRYMKKPLITMVSAGAMLFFYPLHSFAAPQDGLVVKGSASISQDGASTLINQGSARAVIDWRGFDINSNERVQFIQASQNSIALNRVTGGNPTSILGQLAANGRVFISNPNGVVFGAGAKVDVASLMATTLSVNADDFMNGKNTFSQDLAHSPSYVVNQGEIRIADNGFCFLVAPGVENSGTIIAQLGKVVMASGDALTIDFNGDGLLTYTVSGKILDSITGPNGKPFDAAVSNTGSIKAPGGNIVLIGNGAKDAFASVVNNSGIIEATSLDVKAGSVILNAGDGDAVVTGSINVSGLGAGQVGGKVEVLGDRVGLFGKAAIDALGAAGGGTVLVGGDLHGQGGVPTASQTVVGSDATIKANATDVGQGGKVVVWADNTTSFYGNIEARGGAAGGNGGFVETSGKQTLAFNGSVDTRAAQGLTGTLLLDPTNITISIDSQSMSMAYDGTFSDTTTSPSNLITSSLKSALDTSNVTVDTASSLPGAGFIVVVDPVSWPSGNSLTLKARDAITVNPLATITNTGPGGLNFYADGAVTLNASVSLGGGAFNVAGYGGVGTTASSFAATSAGSITTGGSVNIATRGNIDLGNNVMAGIGGVTLTTDAGGTTRLAGNVTTKGGAITVQSPLILASNVVLDTTNGGVVPAGSAINLASVEADDAAAQNRTLALNAGTGGATSVSGSIGATQSLAGLSVVNSNGATFNGAVRVTDGPGLVNLIDTTAGQSISFVNGLRATALNTSMKGFNLSLLGADTHIVNPVTFLNTGTLALGASATDALSFDGGLTADVSSLIMLAGQLNASGAGISLMAPTAITASTTLSGTGSFLLNSVILADGVTLMVGQGGNNSVILGTVDGTMGGMSSNLTINTTGDVSLGAIGGAMGSDMGDVTILNSGTTTFGGSLIGLRSLTTDAGGTSRLGANVTTTGGNITFGDSLILTGNASLNSGSGTITFSSTVDATNAGVQSLTLNAGTGDVLFSGVVGGSTGLGSIDITNVRNLTAGAITAARLTSHGTGIATLNGDLTMTGDGLNGGVDISASQNLLSMNTVSAVNANLRFGGNSPSSGDTVLANDMIFTTTGSGTVNFDGSLGSQSLPRILNVNLGTGWIENYTDGAIPVDVRLLGGSSLLISGNYFIPNAGLTYNVPVQLGGNVIFSPSGGATLGDLQFKSTVDSNGTPWNLGITALGSVQFDRAVGHNNLLGDINITSGHNLSISSSLAAKTFTSNVLNTTTLGGNITTTGAAGVNISSANTLLVTDVTFNAGSGAIRLNTPVNGAYLLTLDSSGLTSIVGTVGISALTTDAQGTTEIWRNVTTSGDQFYNDAVILKGDATLASNAPGNITFGSTIDGTQSLTVNTAGSTIFGGAVGNSSGLYSLTTDAPGTTRIGGNIRTVGFQSYNDAVILTDDTILSNFGAGNITFASTLDAMNAGVQSLTVNTFGSTIFGGAVGNSSGLYSLTTDAPGTTRIGGNIRTVVFQSYNDAVILTNDTILSNFSAGNITFASMLDAMNAGEQSLTVNTLGSTIFGGAVGNSSGLYSLTTDAPGTTRIGGNIRTVGFQSYNDAVILMGNVTLNGDNIAFDSTIDATSAGAQSLTVNAFGSTVFGRDVGSTTVLASLTTDAPGNTFLGGNNITTTGAQSYNDVVFLSGNAVLTSGIGPITFQSSIDGGFGLTLNTGGMVAVNGNIGSSNVLGSLILANSAGATFNAINAGTLDLHDTSGSITVNGNLNLNTLVTASKGYNLSLLGSNNHIVNAATFLNTGTLTLGDSVTDSMSFDGGLTAIAPGSINLAGTITARNAAVTLGGSTLTSNVIIDTSQAPGNPLGGDIFLNGIWNAPGGSSLTLRGGSAVGGILINARMGQTNSPGALSVTSAGQVTINESITATNNIDITAAGAVDVTVTNRTAVDNITQVKSVNGNISITAPHTTLRDSAIPTAARLYARGSGSSAITVNGPLTIESHDFSLAQVVSDLFVSGVTSDLYLGSDASATPTCDDATMDALLAGSSTLSLTTSGNIIIDCANATFPAGAGTANVTLNAGGTINDNGIGLALRTTGTLTLTAGGAIGGLNDGLSLDVSRINVIGTGNNNVNITNAGTVGDGTYSIDLGASNVTNGIISINQLQNNLIIGSGGLDAGLAGSVNLTVNAGAVLDGNTVGNDIIANTLIVNAVTGAGSIANPIETQVANLTINNTGAGDISFFEADGLTLTAAAGQPGLKAANGNISFGAGGTIIANSDILASGTLILTNSGGANFAGITAGTLDLQDTNGSIVVNGNLSLNTLTTATKGYSLSLLGSNNQIASAVTFLNTGTLTLGDASTDLLTFTGGLTANAPGSINLAGTLTATNSAITFGRPLTLTGNTTINTNGGALSLSALDGGSYNLMAETGTLTLSGAINTTNTGNTTLKTTTGDIVLSNSVGNATGNTTLISAGKITGAGLVSGNEVTLDSATGVGTGTGGRVNTSATTLAARSRTSGGVYVNELDGVTLNAIGGVANNAFGTAYDLTAGGTITVSGALNTATTGNTLLRATTGDIVLDAIAGNTTANMTLTSAGAISQVAGFVIANQVTLAAGSGSDITLDSATNNFGTVSITSGKNVTLVDADALDLGVSTITGNFDVTAGGAITDSGALAVTGTTTLSAGADDITLDSAPNNFSTVSITSGKNVTLVDATALDLGVSTVMGNLDVTAGGAITDSGALAVTGTTLLSAGANDITLDTATNNFSTVAISSGKNVSLVDSNALDLGASTISGNLDVTAGGAITDSGALAVTGKATLSAGANDITLDTATNNFGTVVISSGKNVTLVDANTIDLGASTVSGTLDVTAGGAITDSGALAVTGTTTLSAGANDITLDTATNNFSTVLVKNGKNVSLVDANAINLGAAIVDGTLDVKAGGAITDSDALSVTGTTTLSAGANDITLDTASNNFSTVAITSGKKVTLVDLNSIDLGSSSVSDNLNVTAGGAITDTGASVVTAHDMVLSGQGGIGSSVAPIKAVVTNLDVTATDASAGIYLAGQGALSSIVARTNNGTTRITFTGGALSFDEGTALFNSSGVSLVTFNNTGGNIVLGTVNAGSGTANLTASGSILDDIAESADDPVADITAQTVNLAVTGESSIIGTARNPLEINVVNLNALTAGGGIFLNDIAGGVAVGLVDAGGTAGGTVNLKATNGSIIESGSDPEADLVGETVTLEVTGSGSTIGTLANTLEIDAGEHTLNAKSEGGSINLNDTEGGFGIGLVDAGGTAGGDVTLTATGGSITESGADTSADIVGKTVNLTVTGSSSTIGSGGNALEIDAATLDASTAGGNINLHDIEGGFAAGRINAGGIAGGDVMLTVTNGNIMESGSDPDIIGKSVRFVVNGEGGYSIGESTNMFQVDAESLHIFNPGGKVFIDLNGTASTFLNGKLPSGLFFDEGGLPELIVAGTQLMGGSMLDQLHNGGSEIDAYQFAKEDEDIIDKIEEPEPKVLFEGTDPLALHDHVIK